MELHIRDNNQYHSGEHGHSHEHEHDHEHSHEHTHEDGELHSHVHVHVHSHEHAHDKCYEHKHENPKDEDTALLKYMFDHNSHHAKELTELAEKLSGSGKAEAAELIKNAVSFFNQGNAELEKALNSIQKK